MISTIFNIVYDELTTYRIGVFLYTAHFRSKYNVRRHALSPKKKTIASFYAHKTFVGLIFENVRVIFTLG